MIVLGIESSCDECSAAVVEDGKTVRSNIILSQEEIHRPFYGIVPEIASRSHMDSIGPVVQASLEKASISMKVR